MPKALLIGGNGFIGSHLTDELLARGYAVRSLDCFPERFRDPVPGVEYVMGSFTDGKLVAEAARGCDTLIHLAHTTVPASSLNHPEQEITDSISAFVNVLNVLRGTPIKVVYFSSGGAVYGNAEIIPTPEEASLNPISPYGVAKLAMEKYLQMFHYLYGMEYLIIRPSNPYGPRQNFLGSQGVIPIFMQRILTGVPISIWGDGTTEKDYVFVKDLARATAELMQAGVKNDVFNISSRTGITLSALIQSIERVVGCAAKLEYRAAKNYDVHRMILCNRKLKERTGCQADTPQDKGLQQTAEWLRGQLKTGL